LTPSSLRKLLPLLVGICLLGVVVLASAPTASGAGSGPPKYDELPDPLARGTYAPHRTDPIKLGTYTFDESNYKGGAPTGANTPLTNAQIRGVLWTPEGDPNKSPLIFFVHGNHTECDSGSAPACKIYKRNDEGYNYIAENMVTWGYTVFSLDQDELMARQDNEGKGMHARRLLIQAALEKLKEASTTDVPETTNSNVGDLLDGKLDMSRIGLIGHSRGGDAVASYVLYDESLPKGEQFPLRGVVSIAPVDYERHSPTGVPYMTVFGSCDGDVSNLQGARLYERSQYQDNDPYPSYQVVQVGGNHDAYNTVWQADGDDANQADAACHPASTVPAAESGTGIRLSGEAGPLFTEPTAEKSYVIEDINKLDPTKNTRISGEASRMGDQQKLGLATVSSFLRRYVGGEGAFEPYLTGELAAEGKPSVPQSACPTSIEGARLKCIDRVADSYTAPPSEREDVLRPDTEHPTTVDALGTAIEASGFANPYPKGGGIQPRPATTAGGIDWCDPDPKQIEPAVLKETEFPTAAKSCPQPAAHTLGGQGRNETPGAEATNEPRENAPVNGSYGRQLALAWEGPAQMSMNIPAKDGNVSNYRALYMATAVNFFDTRNPPRGAEGLWNPEAAPQNFTIAVTDAEGHEATVEADNPDFGTAMQQTLGNTSDRVHVILRDLRVPLAEFAEKGVNLSKLRKLELRFGEEGMPSSGSIQLADVRFEQPATGYSNVFLETTEGNGPGDGVLTSGPDPVKEYEEGRYSGRDGDYEIPNVTKEPGTNVWTVDDDGAQCPNAQFEHIQEAVEYANPWDTIVVCPGLYLESSKPVGSELNPVSGEGEMDGLTINKPVKIIGAGASKVTIKPATSLTTLGGTIAGVPAGTLRDGGGNVITVSRQAFGSTEYDENYVDISGVKIESGSTTAEAGVAFFNASGRIADSEIGTIKSVNSNGWGVVETNSDQASGTGAPERQVTLVNDIIKGYTTGGVLFDGSKGGVDGAATNTATSGEPQVGFIKGSVIEGASTTGSVPLTGVAIRSGATATITDSQITKNQATKAATASYGILAAEAGPVTVKGSKITLNGAKGYALYNGNAEVTGVSTEAAIEATENFWGQEGLPKTGESVIVTSKPTSDEEGTEGPVNVASPLSAIPSIPTVIVTEPENAEHVKVKVYTPTVPAMPDAAPVGEIVNPDGGETVEAGVAVEPVVTAEDDYNVRSVSLKANGVAVGTRGVAPYTFTWTPTKAQIGTSVELEAKITDSAGQVTTDTITVPVAKSAAETGAEQTAKEEQEANEKQEAEVKKAAEEKAEEKAAAEKEVKEAKEAAEAAEKASKEASEAAEKSATEAAEAAEEAARASATAAEEAAAKVAAEASARADAAAKSAEETAVSAAAAVKAAEEKAEAASKEAADAKKAAEEAAEKAAQITFGALSKNTKKGTASLGVVVPAPGPLVVSGADIKKVTGNPTGPGEVQILIAAKGSALKTLKAKGKVTVLVEATLSASSGTKRETTSVTLVKKK
jgi:hypothetical protein